jgi:hypothetical protein
MLKAAGCDGADHLFRQRDDAVEAEHFRIRSTRAGTQHEKIAIRRDAEVIAVLRLQSVAQRVDTRRARPCREFP